MREGWQEKSIAEVAEIIGGGTPKTSNSSYWNGDIPWLSVVDFNNSNRWIHKTEKTITLLGLEESSAKILEKGQLIISARGTVGALAQLGKKMAFNQSCYGLNALSNFVTNDYLYYSLKNSIKDIKRNTHGSVFDTITRDTFKYIKIQIPSIVAQKSIADILSSLDSKIELNNKINLELEKMAKTIYDYWFVQFNFPDENGKPYKLSGGKMTYNHELKREIPDGFKTGTLWDIATYFNGLPMQKYRPTNNEYLPIIKIKEINEGFSNRTEKATINIPNEAIINNGDVLFSWSASLNIVIWSGGKGALNQHIFKVTSQIYPKSFYYYKLINYLNHFKMMAENRKTTMGHITQDHLKQSALSLPSMHYIKKLDSIVSPYLEKIVLLRQQNQQLAKLRDWLLPMLMNGQVTIEE